MKKSFPYIVKPFNTEEYGVNYVVEYLNFPGITGGGDTQEEAIQIANEALDMYLETLKREGKTIPSPTDFNASGRVTLRLPKTMHLAVIEKAEREGVSLNAYIVDALSQKLYAFNAVDDLFKKLSSEYLIKYNNIPEKLYDNYTIVFDNQGEKTDRMPLKYNESIRMVKEDNEKEEERYAFSI